LKRSSSSGIPLSIASIDSFDVVGLERAVTNLFGYLKKYDDMIGGEVVCQA